ncbi:hypothetical protein HDU67_005741 [Dinochytrium kinnereticum]|nr:hypothetical protein HDU67_005741 [Dinochytrium kinnereticum]
MDHCRSHQRSLGRALWGIMMLTALGIAVPTPVSVKDAAPDVLSFYSITASAKATINSIVSSHESDSGVLLVGTYGGGVVRVPMKPSDPEFLESKDGTAGFLVHQTSNGTFEDPIAVISPKAAFRFTDAVAVPPEFDGVSDEKGKRKGGSIIVVGFFTGGEVVLPMPQFVDENDRPKASKWRKDDDKIVEDVGFLTVKGKKGHENIMIARYTRSSRAHGIIAGFDWAVSYTLSPLAILRESQVQLKAKVIIVPPLPGGGAGDVSGSIIVASSFNGKVLFREGIQFESRRKTVDTFLLELSTSTGQVIDAYQGLIPSETAPETPPVLSVNLISSLAADSNFPECNGATGEVRLTAAVVSYDLNEEEAVAAEKNGQASEGAIPPIKTGRIVRFSKARIPETSNSSATKESGKGKEAVSIEATNNNGVDKGKPVHGIDVEKEKPHINPVTTDAQEKPSVDEIDEALLEDKVHDSQRSGLNASNLHERQNAEDANDFGFHPPPTNNLDISGAIHDLHREAAEQNAVSKNSYKSGFVVSDKILAIPLGRSPLNPFPARPQSGTTAGDSMIIEPFPRIDLEELTVLVVPFASASGKGGVSRRAAEEPPADQCGIFLAGYHFGGRSEFLDLDVSEPHRGVGFVARLSFNLRKLWSIHLPHTTKDFTTRSSIDLSYGDVAFAEGGKDRKRVLYLSGSIPSTVSLNEFPALKGQDPPPSDLGRYVAFLDPAIGNVTLWKWLSLHPESGADIGLRMIVQPDLDKSNAVTIAGTIERKSTVANKDGKFLAVEGFMPWFTVLDSTQLDKEIKVPLNPNSEVAALVAEQDKAKAAVENAVATDAPKKGVPLVVLPVNTGKPTPSLDPTQGKEGNPLATETEKPGKPAEGKGMEEKTAPVADKEIGKPTPVAKETKEDNPTPAVEKGKEETMEPVAEKEKEVKPTPSLKKAMDEKPTSTVEKLKEEKPKSSAENQVEKPTPIAEKGKEDKTTSAPEKEKDNKSTLVAEKNKEEKPTKVSPEEKEEKQTVLPAKEKEDKPVPVKDDKPKEKMEKPVPPPSVEDDDEYQEVPPPGQAEVQDMDESDGPFVDPGAERGGGGFFTFVFLIVVVGAVYIIYTQNNKGGSGGQGSFNIPMRPFHTNRSDLELPDDTELNSSGPTIGSYGGATKSVLNSLISMGTRFLPKSDFATRGRYVPMAENTDPHLHANPSVVSPLTTVVFDSDHGGGEGGAAPEWEGDFDQEWYGRSSPPGGDAGVRHGVASVTSGERKKNILPPVRKNSNDRPPSTSSSSTSPTSFSHISGSNMSATRSPRPHAGTTRLSGLGGPPASGTADWGWEDDDLPELHDGSQSPVAPAGARSEPPARAVEDDLLDALDGSTGQVEVKVTPARDAIPDFDTAVVGGTGGGLAALGSEIHGKKSGDGRKSQDEWGWD